MIGPGKYDHICTVARTLAHAEGAIVLIFGGEAGPGFSAQLPEDLAKEVPRVLRDMADQIEYTMKTEN